jgi:hypothetical protein
MQWEFYSIWMGKEVRQSAWLRARPSFCDLSAAAWCARWFGGGWPAQRRRRKTWSWRATAAAVLSRARCVGVTGCVCDCVSLTRSGLGLAARLLLPRYCGTQHAISARYRQLRPLSSRALSWERYLVAVAPIGRYCNSARNSGRYRRYLVPCVISNLPDCPAHENCHWHEESWMR